MRDLLRDARLLLNETDTRFQVRCFLWSIQAARLYECGFEEHINNLHPADLMILAHHLSGDQRDVVADEAYARAEELVA